MTEFVNRTGRGDRKQAQNTRGQSRNEHDQETGSLNPQSLGPAGGVAGHDGPAAEPMTAEFGGAMEARIADMNERFLNRPPAIPDDNARQNLTSIQRNTQAQHDTAPAGETGVPESVRAVISSSGQSLDSAARETLEDRMGESFSDVQIHTGANAANACEAINARAFTVGNHIAFNRGEYDPSSADGQHLLAHELAHVRQQSGGAISMMPQQGAQLEIDPDPALEREAEQEAARVMSGEELGIQRLGKTAVHIQRVIDPTNARHARWMTNLQMQDITDQVIGILTRALNRRREIVDIRKKIITKLEDRMEEAEHRAVQDPPSQEQIEIAERQLQTAIADMDSVEQLLENPDDLNIPTAQAALEDAQTDLEATQGESDQIFGITPQMRQLAQRAEQI